MATFQYNNLVIIDEDEGIKNRKQQLQDAVIARFPQHGAHTATPQAIQTALQAQFGAFVPVHGITKYESVFLLQIPSPDARRAILSIGFLSMVPFSANLIPWNPDYGSVTTLAYTQLSALSEFDHNASARHLGKRLRQIQLQISGIPPHLCTQGTVRALLSKLARIHQSTFNSSNHTFFLSAETHCLDAFPSTAAIGTQKIRDGNLWLNIWPIWYKTVDITNSMLGFNEELYRPQPDDEATSAHEYTDIERFSPVRDSSSHECGCESDRSMNF